MKKTLVISTIIIILFGLYCRLNIIDSADVWFDEQCTQFTVNQNIFRIMVGKADPVHTPGYFLILKAFSILPSSIYTYRVISIIGFLISLKLLYLLGIKVKSKSLGLILCIVYSLSVYFFNFDWQARMYSLSLSMILFSIFQLSKITEKSTQSTINMFALTNLLGLYLDYSFFWYLMPLLLINIYHFLKYNFHKFYRQMIVSIIISFLGFFILYPEFFLYLKLGLKGIDWTRKYMNLHYILDIFFAGRSGQVFLVYNLLLLTSGIYLILKQNHSIPKIIILSALASSVIAYAYSLLFTPIFHIRSLQIVGISHLFAISYSLIYLYGRKKIYFYLAIIPLIASLSVHLVLHPFNVF